jgi:dihydrofolate synthase/folylpolyglutamate synthase
LQKPKNEFSLVEWLEYLEQRHSCEIQLGLTRVYAVAESMQLLKPSAKVITVAGTNGKGSTVAALEAIYHAAGYKVGTYTSPHLLKFNERIRINKQPISDNTLCLAFSLIEKSRGEIPLTYFEVVTLSALWYYKEQEIDIILLEVGLGGRLDATNIIDADVAIISTIDFDHQEYLGSTLDAIAFEKAGILRTGKPCIYADFEPPSAIISRVKEKQAIGFYLGTDYQIKEEINHFSLTCLGKIKRFPKPCIQLKAAASALVAVECMQSSLPVSYDTQVKAMQEISVPGRLDLHKGEINVLYDVSHNPQAVRLLADYVKQSKCTGKIHAVFSALLDKDVRGLISPLRDCVDRWYPAQLNNKRAASQEMLVHAFYDVGLDITQVYANPETAFLMAKTEAKPQDLIIVYGSFYTVAAIMERRYDEICI